MKENILAMCDSLEAVIRNSVGLEDDLVAVNDLLSKISLSTGDQYISEKKQEIKLYFGMFCGKKKPAPDREQTYVWALQAAENIGKYIRFAQD